MEKTKLGLSVPVVGAMAYLLFLFGGYTPGLLLVGYILLRESDAELKKTALTATLVTLAISAVNAVIGLLPGIYSVFDTLLGIFDESLGIFFLNNVANFLYSVLSLLKTVALAGLAILTVLGKPVKLKFLDSLLGD